VAMMFASCGNSTQTNGNAAQTTTENAEANAPAKEATIESIDAANVKIIITDEKAISEEALEFRDWAGKTAHNEYDFSSASEIKEYKRVLTTFPEKYERANRILSETNWVATWSDDHTKLTVIKNFFGASNTAADILDLNKDAGMTVIMKDGSTIKVAAK